jgi:hypothetical protein
MTAACPYCRQVMIPPEPDKGHWKCRSCNIAQELLGYGVSITYIACSIKGVEYTVRLDGRDLGTQFTRWEQTADGFYIGDIFLVLPGVLNITPSNVVEKIKLYMVFS